MITKPVILGTVLQTTGVRVGWKGEYQNLHQGSHSGSNEVHLVDHQPCIPKLITTVKDKQNNTRIQASKHVIFFVFCKSC